MTYAIAGVNQDQDGRSDMAAQVTADRPAAPVTVYGPDGAQKRPNRDVVIQIMLAGLRCRCHGVYVRVCAWPRCICHLDNYCRWFVHLEWLLRQ